ncbi:MAG: hypothetical protein PVH31_01975 [Ectothiorhodospiraceae bacterium]|jgi:hypothetical protein
MDSVCIRVLLFALAIGAANPVFGRDDMVHVVYRFISPNIQAGTFGAAEREAWLAGSTHLRLEEPPNPEAGVHTLIVGNAPDTWYVDRLSRTGHHRRSSESAYTVPIFPDARHTGIRGLELGAEREYFRQHGARPAGTRIIDGEHVSLSELIFDHTILTLYIRDDGTPYQVAIQSPRATYAVRFSTYESGLEPDPSLFQRPTDVEFVEATD